jgi:hypothetical protein
MTMVMENERWRLVAGGWWLVAGGNELLSLSLALYCTYIIILERDAL